MAFRLKAVARGVVGPLCCLALSCAAESSHTPLVLDGGADTAVDGGRRTASDGQAGGLDAATESDSPASVEVACNDSTGANDCCPPSAIEGSPCTATMVLCWTRCYFDPVVDSGRGMRHEMDCSGGTWASGHGWVECDRLDVGSCRSFTGCCESDMCLFGFDNAA